MSLIEFLPTFPSCSVSHEQLMNQAPTRTNFFHDFFRCSECDEPLSLERSCYLKNGRIYCKSDYFKLIQQSVKCSKCCRSISPSDWVSSVRGQCLSILSCIKSANDSAVYRQITEKIKALSIFRINQSTYNSHLP